MYNWAWTAKVMDFLQIFVILQMDISKDDISMILQVIFSHMYKFSAI